LTKAKTKKPAKPAAAASKAPAIKKPAAKKPEAAKKPVAVSKKAVAKKPEPAKKPMAKKPEPAPKKPVAKKPEPAKKPMPVPAPAAKAPAAKAKAEPAKKQETPVKTASAAKAPAAAAKKPEAAKQALKAPATKQPPAQKAQAVSAPPSRPLPQPVRPPDPKPAAPIKAVPVKPSAAKVKVEFSAGDYVVYPTHGVGKVLRIERQSIAGFELDLMVVEFERDKMTVRVPTTKVQSVGIRKLSSPQKMRTALDTLKGRARVKRAMWSRRAQEYEAKINSGDPVQIAEVVRDLHRNAGQPDQSYSERQIYESALDRLVRELAAVERIDEDSAAKKLDKHLKAA